MSEKIYPIFLCWKNEGWSDKQYYFPKTKEGYILVVHSSSGGLIKFKYLNHEIDIPDNLNTIPCHEFFKKELLKIERKEKLALI